jgi:ligand-binding sensor domain-containing protein
VSKRQILGIMLSIPLLCLVLSSLLLRAQHPLHPNPDFANALWLAKSDGIDKIATADAGALLEIVDVKNVRAVAVDEQRGVLWAYIQNTLWGYHFNGEPALRIALTPPGENGNGKDIALSTNPKNGTVWLGVKKSLYHFGPQGEWLSVHTLSEPVRALSWDPTTACLWVATQKTVNALHDTGDSCKTIDPGPHPDVQDIAVDPDSGDLWVAMKKVLQRYDGSGTLKLAVDVDKLAYLTNDDRGGAWVATDKRLMHIDGSGLMLLDVEPFDGPDKIGAIVHDPTDASVWVAGKTNVRHLSSDGYFLHHVALQGEIRDLALYTRSHTPGYRVHGPRRRCHPQHQHPRHQDAVSRWRLWCRSADSAAVGQ